MFLRFITLKGIFLVGHSREAISDISVNFDHQGYKVQISFVGGEVHEEQSLPRHSRCFRVPEGLQFMLNDEGNRAVTIADLLQVEKRSNLLLLIREIASRVFSAIRNFAIVPELPESLPRGVTEGENVEAELLVWSPETSNDGNSWTPLDLPKNFLLLALLLTDISTSVTRCREHTTLRVELWDNVVEALEDNKQPPPELEFYTNAMGHLRQHNFRLAVVESVICLEIVLAQFLKEHLTISAGVDKKKIGDFLIPEFGLTSRLSGLLNLTLHESYLQNIDLDKVLKVVKWRNGVIHKTGRLPSNIPEDILERGISAVLSLSRLLAERRDNVIATPELRKIKEALKQKTKMGWPQIWLESGHRVRIDLELFSRSDSINYREQLDTLVEESSEKLKARDPRFDPGKHLTIYIKSIFDGSTVWFRNGSLQFPETQKIKNRDTSHLFGVDS